MNPKHFITVWCLVALFLPVTHVSSQDAEPTSDEAILGGPEVPHEIERTLVHRNARGNFVALQGRPEEAALALLVLDPDRREQARAIVREYQMSLGRLLVDNIDVVKENTDAHQAGDREKADALARTLYLSFNPDEVRDPLRESLAEILMPDEHKELCRLVDEYWDAWTDWEMRSARDRSDEAKQKTQIRLAFQLFRQEAGAAYSWSLQPYRNKLETIYEIVEPTEQQRSAIRDVVIDFIRESGLSPTDESRQKTATRIYQLLDEDQRRKFFEHILWRM